MLIELIDIINLHF